MLVKCEPIQDRKRHKIEAKKSTQNLPNKWVRKHKFLIQRLSCLSGFLRYTLYCSGDESEAKTERPAINTAVPGRCLGLRLAGSAYGWANPPITFISSLIGLHSVERVVSEWCRLEGMKLTREWKAPQNVGRRRTGNPRMHRSSAHQLQGANRGKGVRRKSAERKTQGAVPTDPATPGSFLCFDDPVEKQSFTAWLLRGFFSVETELKISMIEHKIWAQHT